MTLAELLNKKKCVPIKGKLHFYTDEENENTAPCLDFPGHKLSKGPDPRSHKVPKVFVVKWDGQTAFCDDDCEWWSWG